MLSVKNLTKVYENGVRALNGVSFDTPDCGLIAITGSSGCGKSTLLNVISGMDEKTDGAIFFDGVECNPKQVKSTFATIYQDYKLIENLSVFDNILVAKELTGSDFKFGEIDKLFKKLGIFECRNEKVLSLSGGQKQRVAIARALVQQPKIIFADEPTGNLDSRNSENIFALLKELSKEKLILIVTHDVETIKKYADRVIKLQDGQIVDDTIICEPQKANEVEKKELAKTPNKTGLKFKTAMSVALAFNKAKPARRIAFIVMSTLLLLIMLVCCDWAMITYENMVSATYNRQNVSNMAVSRYAKDYNVNKPGGGSVSGRIYSDLTPIQEYLKTKKGIVSAKVYSGVLRFFNIPSSALIGDLHSIGANGKLTLQEYAYGYQGPYYRIATDDIESLGIKMVEGRSPTKIGEVAISKSKQMYFNALGGYYDTERYDGFVKVAPSQLFFHDFWGVKIVGVFDDGVEVPNKFADIVANDATPDETYDATSYVTGKVLSGTIIYPAICGKIWDECLYMQGPGQAKAYQGQYIHTSMYANGNMHNTGIGVAPANNLTKYFTGVSNVEKGSVLVSKSFALQNNLKDNDEIKLSTDLIRGEVSFMGSNYIVDKSIQRMKSFKVKVDDRMNTNWSILYNEEDYKMMMDNVKPQANQIMYNIDSLNTIELKQLNNYCKKLFGVSNFGGFSSLLTYDIDDGIPLSSIYFEMRMIGNYVMIAVSAVLAIVIAVMLYNSISIIINSKANDLLILKSLGASKMDFYKIYGIFSIAQLLIELFIGIGLGIGGVFLINTFITKVASSVLYVQLPLVPLAVLTTILIAVCASVVSLVFNINKINDKNLRKAFQKTKE